METKEPVLLVVLITTADFRWHVAGISLAGAPLPLLQSEPGNLNAYLGGTDDEQLSFLRHRLSGVLQRGCDRLWGRQKKPCQIVFVADGPFAQAPAELTRRVAEHFVQWMTSPPVVYFTSPDGFDTATSPSLEHVAGELETSHRRALETGLPHLIGALDRPQAWNADDIQPAPE
jgi:hypothetical protein